MNVQLEKTFTLPLPFHSIPSSQIGWHPPTLVWAELLYSSTDSNTNLFQKHHRRLTQKYCFISSFSLLPVEATQEINHPSYHLPSGSRVYQAQGTAGLWLTGDPAHMMVGTLAERRGQTPSLSLCLSPAVPLGHALAQMLMMLMGIQGFISLPGQDRHSDCPQFLLSKAAKASMAVRPPFAG